MNQLSQKQVEANRNNALLGGVKTDEGKAISRFNALQHGILRTSISEYEKFDFESLYDSLKSDFAPKTILEEIILERIAVSYIKLLRVSKAEADFIKEIMSPKEMPDLYPSHKYESELQVNDFEKLATIYSRYESSVENRLYKAVNKLIELKRSQIGNKSE